MNVLHVYRTYFPDTQGGLEETIRQICRSTAAHGADSRVFTLSRSPTPAVVETPEATIYRSSLDFEIASCSVSLSAGRRFGALVGWADIINYHFPWPFADCLHFRYAAGKPTVVTYHSDIVRQRVLRVIYSPVMGRFLRSVDSIVCTSPNYFATSDVLPRFQEKVEVIPIGISEDSYPEVAPDTLQAMRESYGESFFLFVGVLRYYKGLHILLEAARGANYRIVIVGSGPTERALKDQAASLGLNNVAFAGSIDDEQKMALFQLCAGVVFPSYLRAEAFGVTLLEGAMSGKPLISTEVGSGTSHVNMHEQTGLVVPPGNAKALRDAMDQLHSRPDVAALYGKRARVRYEQLFSAGLMGIRYHDLYSRVAAVDKPSGEASDDTEDAPKRPETGRSVSKR